jgi:hypothetical protein
MIEIKTQKIRINGGLLRIARLDAEKYLFPDDPEVIIEGLRSLGKRVDLFTFVQKVSETKPKYLYPMEWDNLAVLPISTFDNWWSTQIDAKTRNMVRKAEKKGVVLLEVPFSNSLVRGIWEIYNETPIRQGKRFPHFGKSIEAVRNAEATYLHCSSFIGAFLDDRLIGFVKLLWNFDRSQVGLLNIVSLVGHRDKAPTNALLAQAVRFCADKEIPYLVYSNFSYGKKQRDSLSDFKRNNGFQRINLPRYYVPLTAWGGIAFRLGLHRKISERIPEPLIVKFRQLRSSLHGRRSQIDNERN